MRAAASVLLLCSAPASAREAPPSGRAALVAVSARGEAEPGHASRADAIERNASSAPSSGGQDSGNRSAAQWKLPSNRSSFLDVEESVLKIRGAVRFMDKTDAKLVAGVLGACIVVCLCVVVMWVAGNDSQGEAARRNQQRMAAQQQQFMGPPPQSPGQLQRPPGVPYPGAPPSPAYGPGPNPAWWAGPPVAQGQAVQYLAPNTPIAPSAGGAKDEAALFDTYEYRRASRNAGDIYG